MYYKNKFDSPDALAYQAIRELLPEALADRLDQFDPLVDGPSLQVLDLGGNPDAALLYLPHGIRYTIVGKLNAPRSKKARARGAYVLKADPLSADAYARDNDVTIALRLDKFQDRGGIVVRLAQATAVNGAAFVHWDPEKADAAGVTTTLKRHFAGVVHVEIPKSGVLALCKWPYCKTKQEMRG